MLLYNYNKSTEKPNITCTICFNLASLITERSARVCHYNSQKQIFSFPGLGICNIVVGWSWSVGSQSQQEGISCSFLPLILWSVGGRGGGGD